MDARLVLTTEPRLQQRLSPELVAFVQSLALSAADLEREVEHALAENPALERIDTGAGPTTDGLGSGNPGAANTVGLLAARSSWREELVAEARLLCSTEDAPVVEFVVGSLDEHGFLTTGPDTIAAAAGTCIGTAGRALKAVQRAGPPGVAARDARESLLAQLDALEQLGDVHPLARPLIGDHLAALARGGIGGIASALGVSRDEVLAARDFISTRLRPWPAPAGPHTTVAEPRDSVLADVIVSERSGEPGRLDVELADSTRFRLGVSSLWERALEQEDSLNPAERQCVRLRVLRARSFVSRLRRRERSLLAVARCVVDRQRDYILRGPHFFRPLTRAGVARELGVHESTVGRAVAGKHALLPSGRLVALADLFDSGTGVREELARVVAAESRPLSDADLARELARLGFPVARRTVAKYRARLHIPAQSLR